MNLAVVVFDFMGLVKDNNFKIPKESESPRRLAALRARGS
jgi:hypothetical protein